MREAGYAGTGSPGNSGREGRPASAASKVAIASFAVYVVLLFFGTSLPFAEKATKLTQLSTSNPVNQYGFSLLFLLSFLSLLPVRGRLLDLARKEKFLCLFLAWSLASVFWSAYVLVSFKRWIQLLGTVVVFSAALLHFESEEKALGCLKAVLVAYLPLSLLSVLLVPGAMEPGMDAWRALTPQKNTLGQVSLGCLIVCTFAAAAADPGKRVVPILLGGISLLLLLGSRSTTSYFVTGFLVAVAGVCWAERIFLRPVSGTVLSRLIVLAFFLSLFLIVFLSPDIVEYLVSLFGKDMTFTMRVDIWRVVLSDAKQNLMHGCGFGGYWLPENPALVAMFRELPWVINQAHMGYLDILNETGIVGLALFFLMLLGYGKGLLGREAPGPWKWFVLSALVINLTESTFFRLHEVNGDLFLLSYLALFVGALRDSPSGFPPTTAGSRPIRGTDATR